MKAIKGVRKKGKTIVKNKGKEKETKEEGIREEKGKCGEDKGRQQKRKE